MLWGGLKPIRRRFIIDVGTLSALTYSVLIPAPALSLAHRGILVASCFITIFTAGLTSRWTVSFPMIPIVLLQCSRYYTAYSTAGTGAWTGAWTWTALVIKTISLLLIAKSFILTILFPAVKISKPKGEYNVGIVDMHIPVDNFEHDHVTVKLLYPTNDKNDRLPHFAKDTSKRICASFMKTGAPPPLNNFGFMLDQWRLSTVDGKRNAIPHLPEKGTHSHTHADNDNNNDNDNGADNDTSTSMKMKTGKAVRSKLPIVIYSHGLTGSAEIYSYQNMSLAANGTFVMSITHSDASAIGVKRRDGSFIDYDPHISQLSKKKDSFVQSVRKRRWQVEYRARELLAAVDALTKLNETNVDDLEEVGVSFVDKLDLNDMIVMGHSFGGATSINAANMRPDLFTCCIAHDPAVDWCTDVCRKALFPKDRFSGSEMKYEGGTGGINGHEDDDDDDAQSPNIQDLDLFFLYSYQWARLGWGHYTYLRDLFKRGQLGRTNGATDVTFVYNANHSEFSDSCMHLPLWLARAVGVTGKRNPHETSSEIFDRTFAFIKEAREKRETKSKNN